MLSKPCRSFPRVLDFAATVVIAATLRADFAVKLATRQPSATHGEKYASRRWRREVQRETEWKQTRSRAGRGAVLGRICGEKLLQAEILDLTPEIACRSAGGGL